MPSAERSALLRKVDEFPGFRFALPRANFRGPFQGRRETASSCGVRSRVCARLAAVFLELCPLFARAFLEL